MSTVNLVEQLKALGISENTAKYALAKNNNDPNRAANYVFSGAASKDEVSERPNIPEEESPPFHASNSLDNSPNPKRAKLFGLRRSSPRDSPKDVTVELTEDQASNLILAALDRDAPGSATKERGRAERGRGSISGEVPKKTGGALAALGLRAAGVTVSPPITPNNPTLKLPSQPVGGGGGRRSSSPFFRARKSREEARKRDTSPDVGPLQKDKDNYESDGESVGTDLPSLQPRKYRPQASAYNDDDESGTEAETELETEDDFDNDNDEFDEEIMFDEETEKNTEANALFFEGAAEEEGNIKAEADENGNFDRYGEEVEQDTLGEGPNVVVPPEPLFQQPNTKRKQLKSGLELEISRPIYARDRCTITLTHGEPDDALEESGKRLRRYVVLSDLSEESNYAVEWAIGTVARDGDELFVISVKEDESKVDPKSWSNSDKALKLRVQKERQVTALLLSRQVTGLLQRTRLNITVTCQFLHAKNAKHMLLDLVDFLEPTMVIVGSRGLGKLKGILLGSTSHYLVQKSSVPVMVARRRMRRPLRKTNPADLRHAPRVSLASASIEKTASSKQEDEVVDLAAQEEVDERRQSQMGAAQGGELISAGTGGGPEH